MLGFGLEELVVRQIEQKRSQKPAQGRPVHSVAFNNGGATGGATGDSRLRRDLGSFLVVVFLVVVFLEVVVVYDIDIAVLFVIARRQYELARRIVKRRMAVGYVNFLSLLVDVTLGVEQVGLEGCEG